MAQKFVKFSFVATEKARLDAFLTTKLNGEFSRVEVQNFIKNGGVKVNEKVVKKCSFEVKNSDQIDIECAPKNRDTKNASLTIWFRAVMVWQPYNSYFTG